MLAGVEESTPFGARTSYRFTEPYAIEDWQHMQTLLDDATMMGVAAMRFIGDNAVTVVITSAGLRVSKE